MTIMGNVRAAWSVLQGRGAVVLNEGGPWGGGSSGGSGGDGGKGNGPRNPWSQPPEGDRPRGGKGPSALDELVKRAKGARGQLPAGDPNVARWVGYGLLALAGLWIVLTSFHQIQPAERGVVTRLGKYSHTLEPGVSMTLPAPIDQVQTIDVDSIREMQIPGGTGERLVLTRDQNLIDVQYTVRWKIKDPEQWVFQSVEPSDTIRSVAESTMRAALANTTLNDAIGSGRNALAAEVQSRMQAILDSYAVGVTIQGIAIRQTDPPAAVVDAFKEVSAAQQKAQTSINQSRAYAQQIIQKAQGEAGAFDRVYVQYKAAPEVTRRRMYYETMERVLSKVDKTIVEAPGVTPYLPLRELRKPPADTAQGAGQ